MVALITSCLTTTIKCKISWQNTAAHAPCSRCNMKMTRTDMLYFLVQLLQYTKETLAALNLYLELIANFSLKGRTNWCLALDKGPFSYLYARWQCFLPCILQHIENKVSKKQFYDWNKKGKWGKKEKGLGITAPFSLSRELQKAGISWDMLLLPYWIVSSSFS